jgi:SAM-dependent methyltransferase
LTLMTECVWYQRLFDKYAGATDGKAQIAEAVAEFMRSRGLRTVVDVGAGNGVLARLLAGSGVSVLAVEPNPAFAPAWEEPVPRTLRFVACRGQDLPARFGQFDLALLSYVLDSMQTDDVAAVCARLQEIVRPAGAIVGVTYSDDSAWRRYSAAVETVVGPCLVGGEAQVFATLRSAGYYPQPIRRLDTTIGGRSLDELFARLAFFYRRARQEYQESRDELLPELAEHATRDPDGSWSIGVEEVLFTIESGGFACR